MTRSRSSSIASATTLSPGIDLTPYFIEDSSQYTSTLDNFTVIERNAALLTALTETIRSNQHNDNKRDVGKEGQCTPNEMYIGILSGMESLISALEEKVNDECGKEVETVLGLLDLERRVVPFVGEGMFANQFSTTSRQLRLLHALSTSLPSTDDNANTPGSGALCRQILKTCTTLLLLSTNERDVNALFKVMLELAVDGRPKVRKCAWGCFVEIITVECETRQRYDDMHDDTAASGRLKQRKLLCNKIWDYCNSTLKKSDEKRLHHTLRFIESVSSFMECETCIKFGEGCLNLYKTMQSQAVLSTLLSCLDVDNSNEEKVKFASRCLATLLQHRPKDADVFTGYSQCLMACVECMVRSDNGSDDGTSSASKLLVFKLLPNILKTILHLCEADSECTLQFNQFISRITPILISYAYGTQCNVKEVHRVTMEAIPQCLPVIKSVLQIQHRSGWGIMLPGGYATLTTGLSVSYLEYNGDTNEKSQIKSWVQSLIMALLRLRTDVEKDTARTAVEQGIGAVLKGMGLELFLSLVDFVHDDEYGDRKNEGLSSTTTGGGIRDDRAWLLPLMKQCVVTHSRLEGHEQQVFMDTVTMKSHLSFFQGRVLHLARRCDAASADGHRTVAEASIQRMRVIELWALFPAFCVCPVDMKENFAVLAKTLVKALGDHTRYPKLIPIICGGLKTLTLGIIQRSESQQTPESKQDFDVLSNVSTKILPSLFKLVENLIQTPTSNATSEDDAMETDDAPSTKKQEANNQQNMQSVESVTDAIGYLARVCPREFLQNLFKKVVQKLLVASTEVAESDNKEENNLRMCSLLGLAKSLVASGSLDDASLSLLFRAIRPLVRTDEHDPRVQKRAYKVLAEICERHINFVTSSERLEELMDLMVESIVTAQVSARHMRLKCMTLIVSGLDSSNQAHMAIIPKIMGEVLLCLKDSNAKTRDAAYKLLLAMAVSRDDMTEFFKIILAALGAQTSHMRSAAVMALSRLIYEYAREDETVQSLLPSLMQTVSVLFDDSAREVNKSVIGFVRVSVAAMTPESLEPLLPNVAGGLMNYNRGKDRFRAKIKIILKKLVRLYGYETIAPLVPEKDVRLITHMRKLAERAARRKAAGLQDGQATAVDDFDNMMESDEDDSDDGRTFMTGVTGFTKMTSMTGKSTKRSVADRSMKSKGARSTLSNKSNNEGGPQIKAELKGEVLDLLDSSKMARSVHFADMKVDDSDEEDDDDGDYQMQFDNQGRIVISEGLPEIGGTKVNKGFESDDDNDEEENLELKAGGKRRRVSKFESVKIAKAEKDSAKSKKVKNKHQQTQSLGAAYKSKKAGGDVMKKNQKYEPYAFIALNAKDYTKKNRGNAVSKMGTVVRNSKRKRH